MRNDNEIAAEALRRAQGLRGKSEKKKRAGIGIAAVAVCLALIVGLAFVLPAPVGNVAAQPGPESMFYASMLAESGAGGYVLIGIIAFVLGMVVAYLIFKKKK